MQLSTDGRITRAALEDSFCVDHDRRRVLYERKRIKAARVERNRYFRQVRRERMQAAAFADYCRNLMRNIAASLGIPAELIEPNQSNFSSFDPAK